MATSAGPSAGTASQAFNLPGGPVVETLDIQVPAGLPALEPSRAPYVAPEQAGCSVTGQPIVPINTSIATGNGTSIRFANPA